MAAPPVITLVGCTAVYWAELPNAIVLANAFLRFHPEAKFAVLVIDRPNDQAALPNAQVFSLRDLGLEAGDGWRLPMLFGPDQLRSVLTPALLEKVLTTNAAAAAYFSPFTDIFASLSDVLEMVRAADVIISTEPIQNGCDDGGQSFIGAPAAAKPVLREWFGRMRERFDRETAIGTDNLKALDAIFDSLPHRVISPPGVGVNYSNLDPSTLSRTDHGHELDGYDLRSFDFRGYDPDKPHLLSRYLGLEPRILLSEHFLVAELCDAYREKLLRAGYTPGRRATHPFGVLPSGLRIDPRMSRIYCRALHEHESGAGPEPPSPFGPQGEQGFLNWLNEPIDQAKARVTRYMLAIYEDREDVRAAFPDPTNADATGFRDWYLLFGQHELELPAALVPFRKAALAATPAPVPVNIAGYFRAELGIGAAARSLLAALEAAEIPINTVPFDQTANRLSHPFTDRHSDAGRADINLVCVNPDQIGAFAEQAGREFWDGRYSIGVWFWEVEDFPRSFHGAFNHVDEIWVASDFMRDTFRKVSPKPVFKFRLPVLTPQIDPSLSRRALGLPEKFVFLFSFDFLSVLERKNPVGLVEAFARAFRPGEGPVLVIKSINGDKRLLEMEKLKYAIRSRPDILLRDGYLSDVENHTLTALSDCYVSLHRSEGFGLTIAEAMALGKSAIAPAYSGNLEFMTEANSYLCPCQRREVGPEREPYPAASHWCEPDLETAAQLLRHVYLHQEEARKKGMHAADDIRKLHSPTVAGPVIQERLAKIRHRRTNLHPIPTTALLQDRLEELQSIMASRHSRPLDGK
jgi:glycosyltransferase involved in cell wall biosynthesis